MDLARIKKQDWLLSVGIGLLTLIGLVVIYSATFNAKTVVEGAGTINRQLVFVILGFAVYSIIMSIDVTWYRYFIVQLVMFLIIVGMLLFVWLLGDPVRNTNRWIEWGFVRIQPSEYAKIVLILLNSTLLANLFRKRIEKEPDWGKTNAKASERRREMIIGKIKNIDENNPLLMTYLLSGGISLICVFLIMVEPALGNATITAMICFSLFLISYPRQKVLLAIIVSFLLTVNAIVNVVSFSSLYGNFSQYLINGDYDLGLIALSIAVICLIVITLRIRIWPIIFSIIIAVGSVFAVRYLWENEIEAYQKKRVEIFLNPEEDPQGAGWQLRQSKIAIGSGRLFGKGFLQGSQSKLRYLPEAYTDFIFAAFSEEFGLMGGVFLLGLYTFVIVRIIRIGMKANTSYESLVCFGVSVMLMLHVFINIGMNMGILPITGIPLPLVSYGGSSVMVNMIALGLVQAVHNHMDEVDKQESMMITSQGPWKDSSNHVI